MKNNFRRLQMLIKIFGSDHFFNCEATNYAASCIGKYNHELLTKVLEYKFKLSVTSSGYLSLIRGNYSITLTD
jgi:hypothetical protein